MFPIYDTTAEPFAMSPSLYGDAFTPQALNPGADSFGDVLRFGLGRWADYKIATVAPQNTTPYIGPSTLPVRGTTNATAPASLVAGVPSWLLLVGAGAVVALLLSRQA